MKSEKKLPSQLLRHLKITWQLSTKLWWTQDSISLVDVHLALTITRLTKLERISTLPKIKVPIITLEATSQDSITMMMAPNKKILASATAATTQQRPIPVVRLQKTKPTHLNKNTTVLISRKEAQIEFIRRLVLTQVKLPTTTHLIIAQHRDATTMIYLLTATKSKANRVVEAREKTKEKRVCRTMFKQEELNFCLIRWLKKWWTGRPSSQVKHLPSFLIFLEAKRPSLNVSAKNFDPKSLNYSRNYPSTYSRTPTGQHEKIAFVAKEYIPQGQSSIQHN